MSLASLISRVQVVDKELGGAQEDEEDEGLDAFQRMKKQCARQVADVRKMITERDELLEQQGSGTKATVEMSAKIRQQLRGLKDGGAQLKQMHEDAQKKKQKKKKGAALMEDTDARQEVVELVFKHIAECETLEKRRFEKRATAETTDLKDLNDPDLDAGLQMLAQRDKALDDDLDMISTGVGRLKNIALDMKEEIQLQNVMIDEVDQKIDAATDHLIELNKKVKKAFDDAGGATRFIANGIILILVIAAIAYIYKLTKK